MQLRYENGIPSKTWVITLPSVDFKVDGDIVVKLSNGIPVKVKTRYKKDQVILKFSDVVDGEAVLYVTKGKRELFQRPSVRIDNG